MKPIAVALLLSATLTPLPLGGQSLSEVERRITSEVDARAAEAIDLLERAVNINSGSMNFDGVREVGVLFRQEFDALGFETQWIDGTSWDRAGHLIARRDGSGPRLLLIGHLDTVFEPSSPFQSFDREGDRAQGPGVVDMKGGDVVIVHALKALAASGELDDISITIVMTGDEERSGRPLDLARAALIEAAEEADIVLAFENGDSNPMTAVVARRGSSGWRLDVTGAPAHSSQLFQEEVGAGAAYEASRILSEFYDRLAGEPLLTFNPGVMLAGTDVDYDPSAAGGSAFGKSNVVAQTAVVTGDLRTITLEQLERARATMRFVVLESLPRTSATITFDDGYPPLAPSDGNLRLLAMFSQVSEDLGYGEVTAVDPRNAGAADVSFTAGFVEIAIDGLGPGGGNDHTVDEWIDLPTLAMQSKRAAVLMHRLARRPGAE
ncbi:MAG: M20/M25/M40 family metallo-hydrolase [Gemmatimonadetes bacterium]|jgi:glutamate carboxypeptidase|nr:M20/M25/M40 family metallo-hydrolase [Gemmatimonadota bacterium]MEE2846606.1 M20/M25/M40 family metallo-hydrolase [Gemmatimonadota bacterium]HIC53598.1 M20 family peptidase [Gemmatimonadota bacterium]|tara:strand:- start:1484 stop:2791 length:1308 start_codon:yes stop_codon:yes gene_type:complete